MIDKAGNLFATAYLFLIFCIYPFYMKEGYVNIGEAKHEFLVYCSLGGLVILLVLSIVQGVMGIWRRYCMREAYLIRWEQVRISVTDILAALYGIEITVSYLLSDHRQEALWGTEGWRMGLVLQLTFCGLYFAVSRMWKGDAGIWYWVLASSGFVFLLGILDRFSLYVIPLEIRNSGFISTLGNINWFCGYLSVLAPAGACLFLFQDNRLTRWIAGIYLMISFMAGFGQGSSSAFLLFAALFLITLWIAVSRREWVTRWFFMGALWGLSAQIIGVLRTVPGLNYNYETDNACGLFTGSWLPGCLAVLCLLGGVIAGRKRETAGFKESKYKKVRCLLVVIIASVVILWGAAIWFNTKWAIPGLSDRAAVFLFDDAWGNGRGATWKAGVEIFRQMNVREKIFGAGPDCFSAFAYGNSQIAGWLRDYFGDSRLTNAHNELLTSLVNVGIAGTVFYLGIFVSGAYRYMKRAEENPYLTIPVVCIFCYLVHNMVSFAQVLNFPFVFLMIAMGESMIRNKQTKSLTKNVPFSTIMHRQ